jgi:hypothetical protein
MFVTNELSQITVLTDSVSVLVALHVVNERSLIVVRVSTNTVILSLTVAIVS